MTVENAPPDRAPRSPTYSANSKCSGSSARSVGRFGRYPLHKLIDQHGGSGTIIEWLDKLTADCPRKRAASISDQCHARCPDLPKVV